MSRRNALLAVEDRVDLLLKSEVRHPCGCREFLKGKPEQFLVECRMHRQAKEKSKKLIMTNFE